MVEGRSETAKWVRDIVLTVVVLPAILLWLGMTPPQVVIAGLCALALVKAWEHGKLAVTLAVLVAAAAMGGWDWYYFQTFLAQPQPQIQTPKPPTPGPPAPPPESPKAPPKPWVMAEEIEQQKKLGRTLLIYSPQELLAMDSRDEPVDVFRDKWIKLDYPTATVPIPYTLDKKDYFVIEMTFGFIGVVRGSAAAFFDPKKYGDRLLNLRKGDQLKAMCQFVGIDRGKPFNTYGMRDDLLRAYNCDLL